MGDASWKVFSDAGPTALDLSLNADLEKTLRANNMYESEGEAAYREDVRRFTSQRAFLPHLERVDHRQTAHGGGLATQVLCKLDLMVKRWVRGISAKKGYTEPTLSDVRPCPHLRSTLCTSGATLRDRILEVVSCVLPGSLWTSFLGQPCALLLSLCGVPGTRAHPR